MKKYRSSKQQRERRNSTGDKRTYRKERHPTIPCTKTARFEKWPIEGRFASVCSAEEFILEQENRNTTQKTERDVRLLERFWKTKDEDRKMEVFRAVELNEYIRQFILYLHLRWQ